MKIETKKILVKGTKCRIIKGLSGVMEDTHLPWEYLHHEDAFVFVPHCGNPSLRLGPFEFPTCHSQRWPEHKLFALALEGHNWPKKYIEIPEEKFQYLLSQIKKGIETLGQINISLPKWEEDETFIL
uniref:Uncharacterized protein n=1 Tax=viral metagenome TaxID=1070528 RepID=A0A6M3IXX5_9ZZZZ